MPIYSSTPIDKDVMKSYRSDLQSWFFEERELNPKLGNFAVAWVLTKITEPARLFATPFITRIFTKKRELKQELEEENAALKAENKELEEKNAALKAEYKGSPSNTGIMGCREGSVVSVTHALCRMFVSNDSSATKASSYAFMISFASRQQAKGKKRDEDALETFQSRASQLNYSPSLNSSIQTRRSLCKLISGTDKPSALHDTIPSSTQHVLSRSLSLFLPISGINMPRKEVVVRVPVAPIRGCDHSRPIGNFKSATDEITGIIRRPLQHQFEHSAQI